MKVASGGELARFMLALKVVIADRGSAPSLVFDEIDTGVGGAVADAIGVRLARLGRRVQVLAVTHAPQVAARAGHHYLITKDALARGRRTATRVAELEPERRREEIARMLAGAEITAEARAAAERLIRAAAGWRLSLPASGRSDRALSIRVSCLAVRRLRAQRSIPERSDSRNRPLTPDGPLPTPRGEKEPARASPPLLMSARNPWEETR